MDIDDKVMKVDIQVVLKLSSLLHVDSKEKHLCVCLLQGGKGSQHHSKGQQSLHVQYGGWWTLFFYFSIANIYLISELIK